MKKIMERLLVFFIGLPVLLIVVLYLPARSHLCLNILVIIFTALGAMEFQNILKQKNLYFPPVEAAILGSIMPALATAAISFGFYRTGVLTVFMAAVSWLIISRILSTKEEQNAFVNRTAAGFCIMFYPGVFLSWIIALSLLPESSIIIAVFLLMVFLNDSAAWASGMLFGKGNSGIIPASPNKSVAGFIGGIGASILTGVCAASFFPFAFNANRLQQIPSAVILGFCTGVAAVLGDLGESVLKRSAGIKDSGVIMPGRGGILDSVDSIAMAAPVFFLAYRLLFI